MGIILESLAEMEVGENKSRLIMNDRLLIKNE